MKLTVLSSGSCGNCYILENESEALILEAGISLSKTKQALRFNISKVVGVLISHTHGDHAGKAKDYEKVFPVYANSHVIESKELRRSVELRPGVGKKIGNFKVLPFEADHDVPCLGFLINHPEFGNLLFVTDSGSCNYEFADLSHIMIECNFSYEVLNSSIEAGLHPSVAKRVVGSHMELTTCREVLKMQDLSKVYTILLIHLSQNNSDERHFIDVLSKATGKPIHVAKPGLQLELNSKPY